ncbi:ATP synthase F1 subunit delta [bacterium]|nr:ATP synthase F1 subunit delta [bacterium]
MADNRASFAQGYGIALFESLFEMDDKNLINAADKNFADFEQVIESSLELKNFLSSPAFETNEKHEVLKELKNKLNLEEPFYRFLCVLVDQGHFDLYSGIVKSYREAILKSEQKVSVNVTSAFDLSDDQKGRVLYALSKKLGKDVLLNVQVNPALIGGLKAEVDGVIYDASIKGKLNSLQKEMKS